MRIPAFLKHPAFGWLLWLGIPAGLYLTGWHTEVIGQAQRLVLATGLANARTETNVETPPAQQPEASYSIALRTLDGKPVLLKELKGKAIFMNFWTTWCPPCVAEMPGIQDLYTATQSENVAFVMVSVDEDVDKLRRFMRRKKYTFPAYRLADNSIPAMYAGKTIPATFVISGAGKLAFRHEGMAAYNSPDFKAFLLEQAGK